MTVSSPSVHLEFLWFSFSWCLMALRGTKVPQFFVISLSVDRHPGYFCFLDIVERVSVDMNRQVYAQEWYDWMLNAPVSSLWDIASVLVVLLPCPRYWVSLIPPPHQPSSSWHSPLLFTLYLGHSDWSKLKSQSNLTLHFPNSYGCWLWGSFRHSYSSLANSLFSSVPQFLTELFVSLGFSFTVPCIV